MWIRSGAITLLFIVGIPFGVRAWTDAEDRFQIRVKVFQDTPIPKTDVDAVVVIKEGEAIKFFNSGGWPDDPPDVRQFGTRVNGVLSKGGRQVSLKVEFSSAVRSNEASSKVIFGQFVDLQTTVVLGKKKRLHCGGDRWCEITVDNLSDK